jgi:hypothetical protein
MHPHRTADPPAVVAPRDTRAFEHQRRLLLELAVNAPRDGDSPAELAARLDLTRPQLDAASVVLARLGLVRRRRGRLRACPVLLAVEHYWPLGL